MLLKLSRIAPLFILVLNPLLPLVEASDLPQIPSTVEISEKLKLEKKREKRVKDFLAFAASTLETVKSLPEEINDSDIERVEVFFDFELFLNGLDESALSKSNCASTLDSLSGLADPSGNGDAENPVGKAVVSLIQSVCRR